MGLGSEVETNVDRRRGDAGSSELVRSSAEEATPSDDRKKVLHGSSSLPFLLLLTRTCTMHGYRGQRAAGPRSRMHASLSPKPRRTRGNAM